MATAGERGSGQAGAGRQELARQGVMAAWLGWGEGTRGPFAAEWELQVFFAGEKMGDLEGEARGWGTERQDRPEQTADVRSGGRDEYILKRKGNVN